MRRYKIAPSASGAVSANAPACLNTSAKMGTVELTGLVTIRKVAAEATCGGHMSETTNTLSEIQLNRTIV
eukprot:4637-Eustigmatos_ZCMA.PRE.1